MSDNFVFILQDQLPTYYNAALAIFTVASKPNSQKMALAINSYSLTLINLWTNLFGQSHVMTQKSVKKNLLILQTVTTVKFM